MLLGGLKVLDVTDRKGAFCAKLLADMGAWVVKIEKPGGDPSRHAGPFAGGTPHPEKSLSFFYAHTGKKSITLDIKQGEGKKILLSLVRQYDVVIESFSPGYLDGLGLGFRRLARANPKVILASVTGFGQNGPQRHHKTCDLVASACGGQMSVTGRAVPLKLFGNQSFLTASLFAATGILLALRKRRMTGKGDHLDISIQESVAATLEHVMVQYTYEAITPKRQGSLHWDSLFRVFPCKDGFIQMTLFDKWETLVAWMDGEGMADDLCRADYLDDAFRRRRLGHIVRVIERWTKTHTAKALFDLGQLMQFPWAPVETPHNILNSPQLAARAFFKPVCDSQKDVADICPGPPYRLEPGETNVPARAPSAGEDNRTVLGGQLGYSKEKLADLSNRGII